MLNARELVGKVNIAFITLDTLRYDVAVQEWAAGHTPNLAAILPATGWEERHTPGSFTYAAHHAFFAGFLPTPVRAEKASRLFAARFPGSETTGGGTCVFESADFVTGLRTEFDYHTLCIGGVGFFNQLTPLGCVLPNLFVEAHWRPEFGVTDLSSTENQVRFVVERIGELPGERRFFLFLNVSAIHQPNRFYLPETTEDTLMSHAAALRYVDHQLPPLFTALRRRGPCLLIICSDHGTAYGEDGYVGHRLAHPTVWTVPYAETIIGL